MMTYSLFDTQQQPAQNSQYWASANPTVAQAFGQPNGAAGLGNAAYGAPMGGYGAQQWGMPQRQLSQQDVGDVVRQLLPLLPHLVAQTQPQASFAYNPYGQTPFGQTTRMLTPQDVNEVVRQILPLLPQIVGTLQGQAQFPTNPFQGGFGPQPSIGQAAFAQPFGTPAPDGQWSNSHLLPLQQHFGQQMPFSAAFGGSQPWSQQQQRQLSQQDVGEVVRQLTSVIPQVIGNLQASQHNQPRMN